MDGKWRIGAALFACRFTRPDRPATFPAMKELIRTNDAVVLSFAESLLKDAGIGCLVADQNMSVLDGSIGILPRRILVADDDAAQARRILVDAGIANEMRDK
jgi:hypothetical protein